MGGKFSDPCETAHVAGDATVARQRFLGWCRWVRTAAAGVAHGRAGDTGAYSGVVTNISGTNTSEVVNLSFLGDLRFYSGAAGVVLAGAIDQQLRVEYADVVAPGTTNWQLLMNVTLPGSPYLVNDPYSPGRTKRFYRAVLLP